MGAKVAIHTDSPVITHIGDLGRLRAPIEAAGFVFPGDRLIELANRSHTPTTNFEFEPEDVMLAIQAAQLDLTDEDWEDAVFWHTHPGGMIGPSKVDLDNRLGPITHLVVTLTPEGYIPTSY